MSTTIVVSDVHLGFGSPDVASSFHDFLRDVPAAGDHLIINGDLFEFWFEYRHVIPRAAVPTLERLAAVRDRGCSVTLTGGNHDRWGGTFWSEQMGMPFHPDGTTLSLGAERAWVHHGDGLAEPGPLSRAFHRAVTHRVSATLFGIVHPDLGFALVRRLSPWLAHRKHDPERRRAGVDRQRDLAAERFEADPSLTYVILGHTHEPWVEQVLRGRWYLNPGAWADDRRYATLSEHGPQLKRYPDG